MHRLTGSAAFPNVLQKRQEVLGGSVNRGSTFQLDSRLSTPDGTEPNTATPSRAKRNDQLFRRSSGLEPESPRSLSIRRKASFILQDDDSDDGRNFSRRRGEKGKPLVEQSTEEFLRTDVMCNTPIDQYFDDLERAKAGPSKQNNHPKRGKKRSLEMIEEAVEQAEGLSKARATKRTRVTGKLDVPSDLTTGRKTRKPTAKGKEKATSNEERPVRRSTRLTS